LTTDPDKNNSAESLCFIALLRHSQFIIISFMKNRSFSGIISLDTLKDNLFLSMAAIISKEAWMKKSVALWILCIAVSFFVTGCVVAVGPQPEPVAAVAVEGPPPPEAQVEVGAPPPLGISEPELVVVPSGDDYVYMIPNVAGVYFYNGIWYRNYGGGWYTASIYNGPWVGIAAAPGVVIGIDPFYPFYLPVGYYRIGWWDFHRHWRSWGHGHHWHNQRWFKNEMRSDVRHNRMNRIKQDRLRGIDRSKGSFQKSGTFKGTKSGTLKNTKAGTYKGTKSGTYKGTKAGTLKNTKAGGIQKSGAFKGGAVKSSAPKSVPKSSSGGHHNVKQ
jgi:hypothetical protein